MPNRVQKLPITAYDVLGYLIPGAASGAMILYVLHGSGIFKEITVAPTSLGGAMIFLMFIVASYIGGHIIALVSTFTIERVVVIFLGYPSSYLCANLRRDGILRNINSRKFPLLILFLFTPVTFLLLFLLMIFGFIGHFTKSLHPHAVSLLDKKFSKRYGAKISELSSADWFNIVQHDIIAYSQNGASRMYNYLNLYGFCRNMAFAMSLTVYVAILRITFWKLPMHEHFFVFVVLAGGASLFLTLGFMKFFRRYSQEAIMMFIVSTDDRDKPKPPFQGVSFPKKI